MTDPLEKARIYREDADALCGAYLWAFWAAAIYGAFVTAAFGLALWGEMIGECGG